MRIVLSEPDLPYSYKTKKKQILEDSVTEQEKYSNNVLGKIFDDKTAVILKKLDIDKCKMIFIGKKTFFAYCKAISRMKISDADKEELKEKLLIMLALKGKKVYVCSIDESNGCYIANEPDEVVFELSGDFSGYPKLVKASKKMGTVKMKPDFSRNRHVSVISDYLSQYNISVVKSIIKAAMNDLVFITRFNEEMYYHGLTYKGNVISEDAAAAIFGDDRYTKIVDLSEKNKRSAFIALYGITLCGLELNDVYSIDGIFNMQSNRETDNQKRIAGQRVFDLVTNGNKDEFIALLVKMGQALQNLPNIPFELDDPEPIKKNYSLFVGLSDIGRLFLDIISINTNNELKKLLKTAKCLSDYSYIVEFYNSVYESTENKKISDDCNYSYAAKVARRLNSNLR